MIKVKFACGNSKYYKQKQINLIFFLYFRGIDADENENTPEKTKGKKNTNEKVPEKLVWKYFTLCL